MTLNSLRSPLASRGIFRVPQRLGYRSQCSPLLSQQQQQQQRRLLSTVELRPEHFDYKERTIITLNKKTCYSNKNASNPEAATNILAPETTISTFRYDNGIEALRVRQNQVLDMIILPYQGHQIWSLSYFRNYHSSTSNFEKSASSSSSSSSNSSNSSSSSSSSSRATDDYHNIGMQTMFDTPRVIDSSDPWGYLHTYGAFFIHCGILAMGAPGPNDSHGLHGEIANGRFDPSTFVDIDVANNRLTLRGSFTSKRAFDHNYEFVSRHGLHLNPFDVQNVENVQNEQDFLQNMQSMQSGMVENLIQTQVEVLNNYSEALKVMYLAHVNFRPEVRGKLVYSALRESCVGSDGSADGKDVQVRTAVPAHIKATPEYIKFMDDVVGDVGMHEVLDENMLKLLKTELVLTLNNYHAMDDAGVEDIANELDALERSGKYLNNEEFFEKFGDYGYAASMLKFDGEQCGGGDSGSYVIEHKPNQLNKCVRWMVYDPPSIESCGLALPATSNPNGKYEAHKNGEYVTVPAGERLTFDLKHGYLNQPMTKELEKKINASNEKQLQSVKPLSN